MAASSKSDEAERNPVQKAFLTAGLAAFLIVAVYIFTDSGLEHLALFAIGFAIGYTLLHARFGFSSVYRQIVESGNTEMLRAHLLMLGLAAALFSALFILEFGLGGAIPHPALSPISVGLVLGSFMFGFGMEFGSGLAPAALYRMEGARSAMLLTLLGFTSGATIGGAHFGFWNDSLPSSDAFSLAEDTPLGYFGALGILIIVFGLIGIITYTYKMRQRPPALPPLPTAAGWRKFFFGTWPLLVGASLLAILNALVLFVQGEPWMLTASFTLWGSKIVNAVGISVGEWAYWEIQGEMHTLMLPLMSDSRSILNIGVIIGAFVTLSLSGIIRFERPPFHIAIKALVGGTLMGYGATISFGANVGAYFSGIASFSLHAWIWTAMAIAGVYVAYFLEKKFDITKSQQR
ncbi:YeeE/YedE family protein [Aquisalimonas sp.]|uniref:YeeE/YedE family protein n=1 Tax=Aquisalimonas sp. TaxID=1872621 RepID=UPI0025B81C8F|nr:YeeE/YedE family protein [Aquisalimonas sp.]